MEPRKLIAIAILLLLWDRVEFLYYAFEGRDTMVGFLIKGNPVRIDSYVYLASIYIQQVIMATIIYLLFPINAAKYLVLACLICFVEYFLTYGQPITRIPLPRDFYIPVSGSTLRLLAVCFFMWRCVQKALNGNGK
jgi:hypothetical protein